MALPSKMMKKSFPDSPCVTTTSPSSNEVASNASATVSLSHLSRFSVEVKYFPVLGSFQSLEADKTISI